MRKSAFPFCRKGNSSEKKNHTFELAQNTKSLKTPQNEEISCGYVKYSVLFVVNNNGSEVFLSKACMLGSRPKATLNVLYVSPFVCLFRRERDGFDVPLLC